MKKKKEKNGRFVRTLSEHFVDKITGNQDVNPLRNRFEPWFYCRADGACRVDGAGASPRDVLSGKPAPLQHSDHHVHSTDHRQISHRLQ